MKKQEMKYNKEYCTVVANDIIRGKQSMTLQTAKLIRILISQVVKEDKDLKTYTCRISELADFLGVSSQNLYRDIYDICACAMKSVVKIGSNNPKQQWKMFHWVSTAEYDGNGNITLRLSDDIKPYVLELEQWFTTYQLKNILQFNSFYAIRLYEVLKSEIGQKGNMVNTFSIQDLRKFFDCEEKYSAFKDFRIRVIEIALKEINEKSDLYIEVNFIKKGRSYNNIEFISHYCPIETKKEKGLI